MFTGPRMALNTADYLTDRDRRRLASRVLTKTPTQRAIEDAARELEASFAFDGKLTKGGKKPIKMRVGNKGPRDGGVYRNALECIPYDLTQAVTVGMLSERLNLSSAHASAALVYWHKAGAAKREKRTDPATRSANRKEQWYYWRVR